MQAQGVLLRNVCELIFLLGLVGRCSSAGSTPASAPSRERQSQVRDLFVILRMDEFTGSRVCSSEHPDGSSLSG